MMHMPVHCVVVAETTWRFRGSLFFSTTEEMAALRPVLRARPWLSAPLHPGLRAIAQQQQQQQQPASSTDHSFSSMAAASPASSSNYIPGRADAAGTASFARKIGAAAGPGHFRTLKAGGDVGDLIVSSLGIGTYLGDDTDAVDREYIESMTRCFTLGVNIVDSASNYRNMRSELAIGQCMARCIKQGIINRNEVIICTKGGFLSFDYREDIEPRTYIENKYVKTNLFKWEEFVGGCHCLSAPFVVNQLEISRRNFGLETIDIFFIHNPEIEFSVVSRGTVLSRIKNCFAALEQCVADGKITMYGLATWNAFRTNSGNKQHISLEELVHYAKDVGGDNHHFKVVQLPYSVRYQEAANTGTQSVRGRRLPLLHAAHQLGISVFASSPLNQANLCKELAPDIRDRFPELGERRTNAHCALQFVRTTPGVLSMFAGMRRVMHVEENAMIINRPANSRTS